MITNATLDAKCLLVEFADGTRSRINREDLPIQDPVRLRLKPLELQLFDPDGISHTMTHATLRRYTEFVYNELSKVPLSRQEPVYSIEEEPGFIVEYDGSGERVSVEHKLTPRKRGETRRI